MQTELKSKHVPAVLPSREAAREEIADHLEELLVRRVRGARTGDHLSGICALADAGLDPARIEEQVVLDSMGGRNARIHLRSCRRRAEDVSLGALGHTLRYPGTRSPCTCLGEELSSVLAAQQGSGARKSSQMREYAVNLLHAGSPEGCEGDPSVITTVESALRAHDPALGSGGRWGKILGEVMIEQLLQHAERGVAGHERRRELSSPITSERAIVVDLDQGIDHSGLRSVEARLALARTLARSARAGEAVVAGRMLLCTASSLAASALARHQHASLRGVELSEHGRIALTLLGEASGLSLAGSLRLARQCVR